MLNKKIIIILTFILILSISSASASADSTDETILSDDSAGLINLDNSNNNLYLDDNQFNLANSNSDNSNNFNLDDSNSDNSNFYLDEDLDNKINENIKNTKTILKENNSSIASFSNLSHILSKASAGDTIILENDYKYDSAYDSQYQGGIEVNSITIDGNNHYIDGNGEARIFYLASDNIVLKNIKFINGFNSQGGAIYAKGTNVNITDCIFENNLAPDNGGAIYVEGNASIKSVKFINNSAGYGGAAYINDSSILEDLIFTGNVANIEGGAVYIGGSSNITNCIFDGNLADKGAAIFIPAKESPMTPSEDVPFDESDLNSTDMDLDSTDMDDNSTDYNFTDMDDNSTDYNFTDMDDNSTDMDDYPDESDEDFPDGGDYVFPDWWEGDEFEYDGIECINVFITNSTFINSNDFYRGAIFSEHDNNISIDGCLFENMSSQYAPAIYCNVMVNILINNTGFKNLHANGTGGAMAFLDNVYAIVDNCSFKNISSSKNGGAIFYDSNSWGHSSPVSLIVLNSSFLNCSSDYGGAIVVLGGGFKSKDSSFINNSARYGAGAVHVYTDYDILVYDTVFYNNRLNEDNTSFGGALFIDSAEKAIINNTRFVNNSNDAIYAYESRIKINNSYFENNDEYLRSIYTEGLILGDNKYNDDTLVDLDYDPTYIIIGTGEGLKLDLINNTIDVTTIPSSFLAADWGWMSPFKNQDFSGGCWCFSTCAAIESALLKSTQKTYSLSMQNMQKLSTEYSKYGNNHIVEAGSTIVALHYALSWMGVFPEEYDTFDMIGKLSRQISTNETIHIQDAAFTYPRSISYDIDQIKQTIMKYGTVTSDFYAVNEAPNFNENTSAFYCNETDGRDATHAVAVVGWDDNYPASNFLVTPPGDGAWIIKNSYGEENYDHGYVYVSYYDTVFNIDGGVAYLFENTENYTKNYQTDIGGDIFLVNDSDSYSYKNSYQSIGDDYISAVGTCFNDADEDYTVEIYVNNVLKTSQSGKSPFRGFHTIKLENQIQVKIGDNFTVVMKTHSVPIVNTSRMHFKANVSFIDNGTGWKDASDDNATVLLKVYTMETLRENLTDRIPTRIDCKNMTTTAVAAEDGRIGKYFVVFLKDENGTALSNKPIKIGFNGRVYDRTTDENGSAKLQINLAYKGTYTFAIGFLGDNDYLGAFEVAKITVKVQTPKLATSNKSYKASAKTKSLTATFKTANGKVVANKKISFTVNGKTYSAKTNSKGIATVKVSLNKKGTYSFTVKFAGDNTFAAVSKKGKLTLS
ncbi:adhesin-like protein with cysteine protease domain [Methanobrevibacter ruminantium M1]|uniref:Adhesin-like protein with cysteine protease domain n=2 Tax=Methanobrevibacter ruminantium TaxID=83816 RepID=D3E217_METRM|nr:adhesin-like protein with cysteine protease domain [Methanobrevibacter ruminantium M1]